MADRQSTLFEELEGTLRDRVIDAISQVMRMTFVLFPIAGAVMFVAAMFMKWEKPFGYGIAVGG